MAGEPVTVVQELWSALDRKDFASILTMLDDEVQLVDEITRRWLRGREEVAAHVRELESAISHLHSELSDVHERSWGDTGLVTGWLEQNYTLEGKPQHVSAPTVVALRRAGDVWKIVMVQSIPLPKSSAS